MFTAEEILEQIFADQDSEKPGDFSDFLDSEEEEAEEESADEAEIFAETGESSELGPTNFVVIPTISHISVKRAVVVFTAEDKFVLEVENKMGDTR